MIKSLIRNFTPKEPKYFPLLKELSEVIIATSDLMIDCVRVNDHEKTADFYKKIKEAEKKGDLLSNRIYDELNHSFLTPFDREDMHLLAATLDDVIDFIYSSAKRIMLYKPQAMPETAVNLAQLIHDSGVCISQAVDALEYLKKDTAKIMDYCKELHDIENKADDVYEEFIIELFKRETDSIELLKVKEIMKEMEKATNAAEQVGKIIRTIIVKHA